MAINYDKLLALKIPDVEHSYGPKDCMLYALGLGLGYDPVDEDQLAFVYEKSLKVLPTMAVVIGHPGFWVKDLDTGIDWVKVVAGEYSVKLHQPLQPAGSVVSKTRVTEIIDKGAGKGAVLYSERTIDDKATGARIATLHHTTFCRADGGFGGPPRQQPAPHPIPERAADLVCDLPTRPEMALIYRLSADPNPLHADPAVAKAAGFPRPILHGLATYGVAGHALLKTLCGYDPAKLTAIAGRFSAPVFPGETIRTEMWRDGAVVSFRARVVERDVVAINNGRAEIAPIRESVRALCANFPGEYWRALDRERGYPTEFVAALTKAGFLAALIPEQYGGSGLPLSAAAAIMEEIHASGGNGAACHAQMYTMGTLLRHGSAAQKESYLPAIAKGELRLQAFGVTEPTSGTDTLSLRTTAVRDGGAYVVNGQKIWTSRAEHSDLMLLLARTTPREQVAKRTGGLSVLLVDMRTAKGLTIRPIRTMMNHATTEIFFDAMRVPAENLIGEEGDGFRYILSGMNAERILIASECIGDARWFIDKATAYAKERKVFGRSIGQNQGVQFPIAHAYAQMRTAALMVREAASLYDAGRDCGAEANMAKLVAADASWAAAEMCVQTHGGFGFAEEFDIERKFRETRLYQVAPISTNLILSYLAEHVLDLPRSY